MPDISPAVQPAAVDMIDRIAAQNLRAVQSQPIAPLDAPGAGAASATGVASFEQTLRAAGQGITLSGHALTRLASRRIELTDGDYAKISDAIKRAAGKGARSSLLLLSRGAAQQVGLVVSVPNRTVITAVDADALKENIFTNIDSAVIL